ncbi:sensor domain-containing diguanylate cyclase [Azohydromonas aeria]|uniref:sensor domain-containing diguanylate cyclase n=1 Tax=Azohydromonas aeria TaxID=2590212 RepID=UPI0018DFC6FD|nr:sensor domain-containing diguanylate cyclase [Azohydromonas aeria]
MNTHQVTQLDPRADRVVRPLLQLMQELTGAETTFLTLIDLDGQQQDVVFALNTAELEVAEGARVPWQDSMCRLAFLSGKPCSADVAADFPGSLGAAQLEMQTFFAVPVTLQGRLVGSLCGASRHRRPVGAGVLRMVELIGQAMASQLSLVARVTEAEARHAQDARAMALLREAVTTDALTGLLNRGAFLARYQQELARAERHGEELAVLVLEVDGIAALRDVHGREAGDRVLQALASTLGAVARVEDVAARLEGDSFALVLTRPREPDPSRTAARIRSVFTQTCAVLGMQVGLGIGLCGSRDTPRAELLYAAERMLSQGRNCAAEPG